MRILMAYGFSLAAERFNLTAFGATDQSGSENQEEKYNL
jgi:hypothetical protein